MSCDWLNKYHKFILFDQFSADCSEDMLKINKESHFKEMHPGPILNQDDIGEVDAKKENLFGTDTIKG